MNGLSEDVKNCIIKYYEGGICMLIFFFIIVIVIVIFFVVISVNDKNERNSFSKEKEELERSQIYYKEKRREEFIADSLQKVQDSLYILKQSNILAQRDGKKIMGSFFWGMSHKDYKSVYYRIINASFHWPSLLSYILRK